MENVTVANALSITEHLKSLADLSPFKTKNIEIYIDYLPADDSGCGDLYDIFSISDNKFSVIIGDISGHGLSANLCMASVIKHLDNLKLKNREIFTKPDELLFELNRSLYEELDSVNMYLTIICAFVDGDNKLFHYCNAGHCQPFLMQNKILKFLKTKNIPVGLERNIIPIKSKISINTTTSFLFYTDGIINVYNKNKKKFGINGLKTAIEFVVGNNKNYNCEKIIKSIIYFSSNFSCGNKSEDDITLLSLKIKSNDRICEIK